MTIERVAGWVLVATWTFIAAFFAILMVAGGAGMWWLAREERRHQERIDRGLLW